MPRRGLRRLKIHGWGGGDDARSLDREVEAVHAVGEAVGDEMDLMHDPACELETFADALELGRALDEQDFFWYEDPFRDGGISHTPTGSGTETRTPILQTVHIRGMEVISDFVASEATDFLRADPEYDAGITGASRWPAWPRRSRSTSSSTRPVPPAPLHRSLPELELHERRFRPGLPEPQPPVFERATRPDGCGRQRRDGQRSDGPGLSVEYDWDYLEDNTTGSVHVYE